MNRHHRFAHGSRRCVALHGFTGTGEDWSALAPLLGADLLAPDLPGHGLRPTPAASFDSCVDELANQMRDLEVAHAHWIGYSMGGRLALAVAARHPDLVASLVLVGASAGIAHRAQRVHRRAADERWARLLEEQGLEAFWEQWDAQPLLASRPARPVPPHQPGQLAQALRRLGRGSQLPLHAELGNVACPTLVVAGEHDHKHVALSHELTNAIPRAYAAIVSGAGHATHVERAEAFAARVESFWRDEKWFPSGNPSAITRTSVSRQPMESPS